MSLHGGHFFNEAHELIGEAGFVVVPGDDLGQGSVENLRGLGIHHAAVGIAGVINGHEGFVGNPHAVIRGGLEHGQQAGRVRGTLQLAGQIHNRDIGGGHPDGQTVQTAGQGRNDPGDGSGGAGGGGDHGQGTGPTSPPVLVGTVQDALAHGIGMDGGHEPVLETEIIVDGRGDGGQAVGGAGGVGDDAVFGFEILVIDAHDDGDVFVFPRGADDDLGGAAGQVLFAGIPVHELAGGLYHEVTAIIRPPPFAAGMPGDAHFAVVDDEAVFRGDRRAGESPMYRIVFEQMGQLGVVGPGVDHRELDFRVGCHEPGQIPADSAKSVDADGDRHDVVLLGKIVRASRTGPEQTVGLGSEALNAQRGV